MKIEKKWKLDFWSFEGKASLSTFARESRKKIEIEFLDVLILLLLNFQFLDLYICELRV